MPGLYPKFAPNGCGFSCRTPTPPSSIRGHGLSSPQCIPRSAPRATCSYRKIGERLEEKIEPVAPMEPTAIESDSSCESVVVSIPASKPHRLKNHFLGCAREVIGYLDILADNNSDRFIRPRVSNIVAHCNRFKNKGKGAGYSQTTVERCLRALRDSGLIKKQ